MGALEILQVIALATSLAPEVVSLVNNMIAAFDQSNLTPEERMQKITELQATLKPMVPK